MTAYIVVHGHAVHLIVDVASIEAPGLAPGLAPQDLPGLAVHPEGEVVPVDHALAHGGVAAQEVVTLVVDQHVEHLAHAASQPECLNSGQSTVSPKCLCIHQILSPDSTRCQNC